MTRSLPFLIGVVLLLTLPLSAQAQLSVEVGPRIGYSHLDVHDPYVGVEVQVGRISSPVTFNANLDYYFVETQEFHSRVYSGLNQVLMVGSLHGVYHFGQDRQRVRPYVGAGLALQGYSFSFDSIESRSGTTSEGFSDTRLDLSPSLLGGVGVNLGRFTPYAQTRLTNFDSVGLSFESGVRVRF